jgi:hypothetical protein
MVSQLRLEEDNVVTRRHYYHDDHNNDEGLRRDRFSFRRQECYYKTWFEYHPRHVYLSSGHFADKTTEARVTIDVAGL